jgi:asparagine synthase (glutamine-hydrolysing)
LAAATARLYPNIEHVVIPNSGESPIKWLDRYFLYQQSPQSNLANAVWGQAIHKAAAEAGANIIFKGSAGNLSISYAGLEWLAYLWSRGRLIRLFRVASSLAREGTPLRTIAARTFGPFIPAPLWYAIRRAQGKAEGIMSFSALNRDRLVEVQRKSAQRAHDLADRPRRDPLENRLWALTSEDGGNAIKGVLAECGLSVRDPTSDRRVVEFCLSVPPEEFVRGGVPRSLARRAFADRLPAEVADFRGRGYQSADWHEALNAARDEIADEVQNIMRCDAAAETLEFGWLRKCLDEWPSGGWHREDVLLKYRLGLLRGVSAGHFIRKVKGTN